MRVRAIANMIIQDYIKYAWRWVIKYKIKQIIPDEALPESDCYVWDITQRFDFEQRSIIRVSLDYERNTCNHLSHGSGTKFLWIHLSVIAIAGISIVLHFKYIFSIISRYQQIRTLHGIKQHTGYQDTSQLRRSFSSNDIKIPEETSNTEHLVSYYIALSIRDYHTLRFKRRMTFIDMERNNYTPLTVIQRKQCLSQLMRTCLKRRNKIRATQQVNQIFKMVELSPFT